MELYYRTLILLILIQLSGIEGGSHCTCRCSSRDSYVVPTENRIYSGTETTVGGRPFQVGLKFFGLFCGGSIYNSRTIITAAHCILANSTASDFRVLVGSLGSPARLELDSPEFAKVEKLSRHPNWNWTKKSGTPVTPWDIGILTLADPIRYSDTVQPIGVVEPGINLAGKAVVASGWGLINAYYQPDYNFASALKEATGTILSAKECQEIYLQDKPLFQTICVRTSKADGPIGQGPCSGDSGGPLTCQVGEITKLCGVVSAVYKCGSEFPQWHTEVNHPQIFKWIVDNAGQPDTPTIKY